MSDSQMWFARLEIVAIAEVCLSMFACLTAPEQSYNVSMGFFTLYSSTLRSGSVNFKCMAFHGLALLFDIILLVRKGDTWDHAGGVIASLTLAVVIVNLFVKCLALVVMVFIHSELGGGHLNYFPSSMGDGGGYRSGYSVISSHSQQSHFQPGFPSFPPNSHLSKQTSRSSSFGNLSAKHATARSLEDDNEQQQQQQQLINSHRPASAASNSSSTPTSSSSLPIAASNSYQN